jgi:hypothetical protein
MWEKRNRHGYAAYQRRSIKNAGRGIIYCGPQSFDAAWQQTNDML